MARSLDSRILDIYESLSRSEQKLADVVLEHQRDIAGYSATELARRAEVSKATAARLFKRLGYRNYNEARREARAVKHWGSPINVLYDFVEPANVDPNMVSHLNNDLANVTRTFEHLPSTDVSSAVVSLQRTDRIWVLGLRNSYALAHYARFLLIMLKSDVRLIPAGGLSFAEEVVDMRAGDVLLAIGFRRRPQVLRSVMKMAQERGLTVIFITDLSASLTARSADIVLRCHSRGVYFTDSYTAAMSLLNYLASALALKLAKRARHRLSLIDDLHDALDPFTGIAK
jgi:DNA-binding MurR/RpiR family transcriptional regulator